MDRPLLIHRRCTAQRKTGDFCDAISIEGMPFPICGNHAVQLYRHLKDIVEAALATPEARLMWEAQSVKAEKAERSVRETRQAWVVYYARIGDLIKIGTTANLVQRMGNYPPNAELLATEPGGYDVETLRLSQFRHLLAHGKEWFAAAADLLAHIKQVREQ